jgi:hypothetical protein
LDEVHFSVEIPGEPCKYIFSREKVITSYAADAVGGPALPKKRSSIADSLMTGITSIPGLGGLSSTSRKSVAEPQPEQVYEQKPDEKVVYLMEVQYYIAIKTGQSPFAAMPPHPYGMLVRSHEGAALLASKGVISDLISSVQASTPLPLTPENDLTTRPENLPGGSKSSSPSPAESLINTRKLKAALWALGHIASSDSGFDAITTEARKIYEVSKETAFIQKKAHQLLQSQQANIILNAEDELPRAIGKDDAEEFAAGILNGTEKMHRSKSTDSVNSIDAEVPQNSGFHPPLPPAINATNLSLLSPSPLTDGSYEPLRSLASHAEADSLSEFGRSIFPIQPAFPLVEWCVRMVREHPNYSVRATVFSVLGLISRSGRGKTLLSKYEWESASLGSSSAVSVPKNSSTLFARSAVEEDLYDREALAQPVPERMKQILAFVSHYSSFDLQVLQLIAKLNGSPGSNSLIRLQHMTKEKPEVFESRELFVNVMHMFETYTFSLKDRRDVVALFSEKAKRRSKKEDATGGATEEKK